MDLFLRIFVISLAVNYVSSEYLVHNANTSVADELKKRVKVVCCVVLGLSNQQETFKSVNATWGKRCNKLVFLHHEDIHFKRSLSQDQRHFRALALKHDNDGDWFMLVAAHGYILLENLRLMLNEYDSKDNIYFMPGHDKVNGLKFVLSKNSLKKIVNAQLDVCNSTKYDDASRHDCMKKLGFRRMDTRDALERERFVADNPYHRKLQPGHHKFWDCRSKPEQKINCLSDFAISFDHVSPDLMYVLDYLIYQLRPYGIHFNVNFDALWNIRQARTTSTRAPFLDHNIVNTNKDDIEDDGDYDYDEENDRENGKGNNLITQNQKTQFKGGHYKSDDDLTTIKKTDIENRRWYKKTENNALDKPEITAIIKKGAYGNELNGLGNKGVAKVTNEDSQEKDSQFEEESFRKGDDINTIKSAEIEKAYWNKNEKNSVVSKVKVTGKTKKTDNKRILLQNANAATVTKNNWSKSEKSGAMNKEKILVNSGGAKRKYKTKKMMRFMS